jgi:putative ABC transport system ATP-binding protein
VRVPLLRLEGVGKTYHEGGAQRRVLDGLDLTIGQGEWLVVLGRSGSGKSSLLNLLAGIDAPSAGRVLFEGVDLATRSEKERTLLRRQRIGFVFQFFHLIPTLTVAENVLLPLELNGRAGETARVDELLAFVGLGDRHASYPDVLSGGEQQRVAIARALAADPPLLLADEPTGNLDVDTAASVLALLETAVRGRGKTLVMATHSREVARAADRVLEVVSGRLVEVETR